MSEAPTYHWIWYGTTEDGANHVSLGRWASHPCQWRYKLADIQPTEHDHPGRTDAITPQTAAKVLLADCDHPCSRATYDWLRTIAGEE